MGRMPKWRRVAFIPEITYFKPIGASPKVSQEVCLSVEEAEAIRLNDLEGIQQEECARRMNISRPTFHRVLGSARNKLADALLNGKAIRIQGGNFEMEMRRFHCINGHEWDVPFETMISAPPQSCPTCNTLDILPHQPLGFGLSGRQQRERYRVNITGRKGEK